MALCEPRWTLCHVLFLNNKHFNDANQYLYTYLWTIEITKSVVFLNIQICAENAYTTHYYL